MNKKTLGIRLIQGLAVLALLTTATTGFAQTTFDWKRYQGSTINVFLQKLPWTDYIMTQVGTFEQQTGITVHAEVLPENQQRAKLTIMMTAGGEGVDVFNTQHSNEGLQYLLAGWYEPLDKYVDDPAMTSREYGYPADFIPAALQDGVIRNVRTSMPIFAQTTILAYRKDLFSAAGLKAPQTLTELEQDAKILTDRQKGQSGICLRGLGVAAAGIVGTFFYGTGGGYADANLNPTLTAPGTVAGFELYGRLAREYGPPGILNYHWFQCQSLFASGKAAMWVDANSVMNPLLDPTKSQVADKVGFALFPQGPAGRIPGFDALGIAIAPASHNKGAAWYFIQWATNAQNSVNAQLRGVPSARLSAWQSPEVQKDRTYAELRDVTEQAMALKDHSSFGSPWVAVPEIRTIVGSAVVASIQNGDINAALVTATDQIQALRRKTGEIK
jgi:multiple sugar transport system substrate-binding protein